jgi:hypothetical protein
MFPRRENIIGNGKPPGNPGAADDSRWTRGRTSLDSETDSAPETADEPSERERDQGRKVVGFCERDLFCVSDLLSPGPS